MKAGALLKKKTRKVATNKLLERRDLRSCSVKQGDGDLYPFQGPCIGAVKAKRVFFLRRSFLRGSCKILLNSSYREAKVQLARNDKPYSFVKTPTGGF